MTNVPCPRCGMPVGLEEEVCSHCRTPRDDKEMEEGRALVRNEEIRLQRRPKRIAAGVLAAVLVTIAWLLRGLVIGPILVAWSEFQIEVEKTRQPSHWVKPRTFAAPPAPAPAAVVAVSSFVFLGTSAAEPRFVPAAELAVEAPGEPAPSEVVPPLVPPPAASAPPDFAPPFDPSIPPSPGELRVTGTVYDLATNAPVHQVKVQFEQKRGGSNWEARTNGSGRYQVSLHRDSADDVFITIEAPGYRKGLLEDGDPPYRDRTPQARAALIAETTDSDLEPVPLRFRRSAQIVELDLVLVPQARK